MLDVIDLHVSFSTTHGKVHALRGVSFSLSKGRTLAIVGESGCGKSVSAQSIMRLIPEPPGNVEKGQVLFQGRDLLRMSEQEMQAIRGNKIAMIFQDPMTSLNPTMTIGKQITEGMIHHQKLSKHEANAKAIDLLDWVGIGEAKKRFSMFPHQFSGGMRQRVMIAIAIALSPDLLIADEPTTALDVTVQAQILALLKRIQTSMIVITHDMGVVADLCDDVVVMYGGIIVEAGSREELFHNPQHPYTKALLSSIPRLDQDPNIELVPIPGAPPSLLFPPKGCPFAARCRQSTPKCESVPPSLQTVRPNHQSGCWLHDSSS